MNLTENQILTLAPDEASKKAGKDLANSSKWMTKGANGQALWGECQGSGSKPYQTQIDLKNIAFKCSCPSRKFPCKHGVALGLLAARQPSIFNETNAPSWVSEWIDKRTQKEEKKEEVKPREVDEAAQAKRQHAREQKVAYGIEELLVWISDIVRKGIMDMSEKGYPFWDGMARRMIDAQAPGLAGMVRSLGNINFFKEGWQSDFLDSLCNIYLVAKGYQHRNRLSPLVLQDIRTWIGFTVNQEDLKAQQSITDIWMVVSKQVAEEDNLIIERNWLYGLNTSQYALILQFLVKGQDGVFLLSPGMYIDAELVFYPSASPLRALIRHQISTSPKTPRQLYGSWKEVAQQDSLLCASFPVRSDRPYAVSQLVPVQYNGTWWLQDSSCDMMPLKENFKGIWKLLSISGGLPLDMVVVGKEKAYEPVGVWHYQTYKAM